MSFNFYFDKVEGDGVGGGVEVYVSNGWGSSTGFTIGVS